MQNLTQLNTPNPINKTLVNSPNKNTQANENKAEANAFQQKLMQQFNIETNNKLTFSNKNMNQKQMNQNPQAATLQKSNAPIKPNKTQPISQTAQQENTKIINNKSNSKLAEASNENAIDDTKNKRSTHTHQSLEADILFNQTDHLTNTVGLLSSDSLVNQASEKNPENTTQNDSPPIGSANSTEALLVALQSLNPRPHTQVNNEQNTPTSESSLENLLPQPQANAIQIDLNKPSQEKSAFTDINNGKFNTNSMVTDEKPHLNNLSDKAQFSALLSAQTIKANETTDTITDTNAQATAIANATSQASPTFQSAKHIEIISAPLTHESWNQAVSQKVIWMANNSQQTATLTLNPPDLGPLQVVINVHHDQTDTTFLSDNKEVRQALQDGMDNLRDAMKEAGIHLGQTNINERQASHNFNQSNQKNNTQQEEKTTTSPTENNNVVKLKKSSGIGLVDTFA